ncbi:cupredoxin domain-containing protein [Patescibacteria group bacterium]|nr:cupredoxin domain-containing protein [Patescibacteria group bacterium]
MQNQNQNQNVNQPLAPGTGLTSAVMGQPPRPPASSPPQQPPQPQPQPQAAKPSPPQPAKVKPSKRKEGKGSKIIMLAMIVLLVGVAAASVYFFLGLSNKDSKLEGKINENQSAVTDHKDKIDKLQTTASEVDTLKQKVSTIEEKSAGYAESSELEAIIDYLKTEDSDSDGLSDYEEVTVYKSSRYKKDTDGDGHDDKSEVDKGYNPNGPGKLSDADSSAADSTTINGEWAGSLSSTSAEAKDFSIEVDENGKVSGSFGFTNKDDGKILSSRVTGTYTYKDNKLDAILINYLTIKDEDTTGSDSTTDSADEVQYKMELTGSLSKETKEIVGSWKITGDAPANWPAGPSGSFKVTKKTTEKNEKLEDSTSDSTSTDDSTAVTKKISVKAFSYGFLPTAITLTEGEKVKFEVTSLDVDHTFTVDELGINVQVKGGQTSTLEFTPSKTGTYDYYSSISGQKDSGMKGTITVEEKSS